MIDNDRIITRKPSRDLLASPVTTIVTDTRAANCIRRAGVETVRDLCKKHAVELLCCQGIGRRCISIYTAVLAPYGLSLGMSDAEINAAIEGRSLRIYISGRISGREKTYREAFATAERRIRKAMPGWTIVSPLRNGLDPASPVSEHMRRDIELITTCTAIYMIDGWQFSAGCRTEHAVALAIGLRVIYEKAETLT